jgi:hypothetical protein
MRKTTVVPHLYYEPYTRILSTDPIKNFKYKFEISQKDAEKWNILYEGEDHFLKIKYCDTLSEIRVNLIPPSNHEDVYDYKPSKVIKLFNFS